MTEKEVAILVSQLDALYPNRFKKDPDTVKAWLIPLEDQDKDEVYMKLKQHTQTSLYPPTIADLMPGKKLPYQVNPLEKLAQWEAEASGSPKR